MTESLGARIEAVLARLPQAEQTMARAKLAKVIRHRRAVLRYPTPGHLGQLARPGYLQTPMLDAIDAAIMRAESGLDRQIIINTPPQEGKTTRLQDAAGWLLLRNPTLRIAFASYEQGIAAQSGLAIRQMIETHGGGYRGQNPGPDRVDMLGLTLDPDRALQTNWALADVPGKKSAKPGGVLSVGIGSSFTGRPADVLVVDDPLKDAKQADSGVYRKAVQDWFQAVANTRLAQDAIVIVIQTRWHEDDLTGWLLGRDQANEFPEWTHINIQAQATENDVLGRQPGEFLLSARGRTPKDWEKKRRDVGTRWWFSLYQGDPSPPEGGVFQRAWFASSRVAVKPEMKMVVVVVDPADNDGDGDEAGVIVGGIGADGHIYLLEDCSGHYTIATWVRVAIFAMLRHGASRIMYEKSLSQLRKSIRAEWKTLRIQARELQRAYVGKMLGKADQWPEKPNLRAVADVSALLSDEADSRDDIVTLERKLLELWPYVDKVLHLPEAGPVVKTIVASGSKTLRAEMVSPDFENGTVHIVGHLPQLEHQMAVWLPTQNSPDRMDAAVHLVTQLRGIGAAAVSKPAKDRMPAKQLEIPQILMSSRYVR